ncbi:MAG: hypothetical protein Ct9H90mP16_12390 [Candidatus Poseidoniales archaeon]|nr:MAG: hypothetical protein Ct9H90mP16_12390 [Candidatus Poseidoniales archaeon]
MEVHAVSRRKSTQWRKDWENLSVLAHPECSADVLEEADFVVSEKMIHEAIRLGRWGPNRRDAITEWELLSE